MARVLLVADTGHDLPGVSQVLTDAGHQIVHLTPAPAQVREAVAAAPDVILLQEPALGPGGQFIRHLKADEALRYAPLVVVTDHSSPEDRHAAFEIGADDYLSWPAAPDEFLGHLRVMFRMRSLYRQLRDRDSETDLLREQAERRHSFENIIGTSYAMHKVFDLISKVTGTTTTVLIHGESGTGKELVARAIHYNSPRRHLNFVIQNCSVFNDNLLESELFGHVRGSFTGAVADKKGLFEVADNGTLFLDEVADMSPALQVKVLRVLQEGTFIPVGGTKLRRVDVRVISATNRPLDEQVAKGEFREDLYYRLNVFRIDLPPLRERPEDIPPLAGHFLEQCCAENGLPNKPFTPQVLDALVAYPWPGNVRELENEVERLVVMARDEARIGADHLSPRIRQAATPQTSVRGRRLEGKLSDALQDLERTMLAEGLHRNGWNKSRTARQLGISRANLVAKVKKYRLKPQPGGAPDGEAPTSTSPPR